MSVSRNDAAAEAPPRGNLDPHEAAREAAAQGDRRVHGGHGQVDETKAGDERGHALVTILMYVGISVLYCVVRDVGNDASLVFAAFESLLGLYLSAVYVTAFGHLHLWGNTAERRCDCDLGNTLRYALSVVGAIVMVTALFVALVLADVIVSFLEAGDDTTRERTARDSAVLLPLITVTTIAFSYALSARDQRLPDGSRALTDGVISLLAIFARFYAAVISVSTGVLALVVRFNDSDDISYTVKWVVGFELGFFVLLSAMLFFPPKVTLPFCERWARSLYSIFVPLAYVTLFCVDVVWDADEVLGSHQWVALAPPLVVFVMYMLTRRLDYASSDTSYAGLRNEAETFRAAAPAAAAEAAGAEAQAAGRERP